MFVFTLFNHKFSFWNRDLIPWLNKTLIMNQDIVVSRKWEKFQISVDKDWKAFLVKQNDIKSKVEFTETMIDNYKVLKRSVNSKNHRLNWRKKWLMDMPQKIPIIWLAIKYPRKFIKLASNFVSEVKSFSNSSKTTYEKKINKYNFVFREKTLWNNPHNLLKHPKTTIWKWIKSVLNLHNESNNPTFSKLNRSMCENLKWTDVKKWDLIVDQNWKEFIAISSKPNEAIISWISNDGNFWKETMITENNMKEYRVVKREWKRNLLYVGGRVLDWTANNVPLTNLVIGWSRYIL
jgi:hypothetical protein